MLARCLSNFREIEQFQIWISWLLTLQYDVLSGTETGPRSSRPLHDITYSVLVTRYTYIVMSGVCVTKVTISVCFVDSRGYTYLVPEHLQPSGWCRPVTAYKLYPGTVWKNWNVDRTYNYFVITEQWDDLTPPWTNGHHFAVDAFECIFVYEKFCILIKIALKFVSKCSIDNNSVLV